MGSRIEEASLDSDDWRVFAMYGRMMLSAQFLEFSIFQLAHLNSREEKRPEVALRKVEGLLKQPAADQARGLRDLPDDLKQVLIEALDVRNKLVHSFLTEYRIKANVDEKAVDWALSLLEASRDQFDELAEDLDEYATAQLSAKGIEKPYLDEEEMEGLRSDLEAWSEEMDFLGEDENGEARKDNS